MRYTLANAHVVDGGRLVLRDVAIEGASICASDDATGPSIDLSGYVVAPALIDLHAHGALGHSFESATSEQFDAIVRAHAERGVGTIVPTLVSSDLETTERFLDEVSARRFRAHLEGPCLNPLQRGAHDGRALRLPDAAVIELVRRRADAIAILTLAPELPGALALVAAAAEAGVVVAAGHSEATVAEVEQARLCGLSHVVHLWSSQSSVRRHGPWRVPGLLEAALASEDLTCEVIADGRHLPPELLRIALRCAAGRLCVVSDATAGAGLADGAEYRLGERLCHVEDGVGVVTGVDVFGGSTTYLADMLRFLHETLGVPVPELVTMASTLPAKILGLPRKGTLAAGADADVVVFDGALNVAAVILGGSVAHASPELDARLRP